MFEPSNDVPLKSHTVARIRVVLAALMFALYIAGLAQAQPSFSPDASDALMPGNNRTYLDLLQLVMPGISVSGGAYSEARQPTGIRHIGGWVDGDIGLAPAGLLKLQAVPLRSGGRQRMALLIDFGTTEFSVGYAILGLFDIEGEPTLLDAADVARDRWTSFMDPVRLSVGAGDDLLVIQSTHHNSSQAYTAVSMILVRNSRFELVDTISLLSQRVNGFEHTQHLTVKQGAGEPFAEIVAKVTERTTPAIESSYEEAPPGPSARTIKVTYRWNSAAQRYVSDSDALAILERENEKRF